MTPTEPSATSAAPGRRRRRVGRSPTSTRGPPRRRSARCRRRCTPTRTRAGSAAAGPRRPRGLAGRGGRRARSATRCSTPTWLDAPLRPARPRRPGHRRRLLDVVKAPRPGGFELWVFESNTGARRLLRPPRPGRGRAHRRRRQRGAGSRHPDGLAGRRPAGLLRRDGRGGGRAAGRPAGPPGGAHPGRAGVRRRSPRPDAAGAGDRRPDRRGVQELGAERVARIITR